VILTVTALDSSANTLNKPSLFWLAIILTLTGFWLSPYPPLVDFAQHSAQIVTLQEYWSGNPVYTETFELNWFAPYTATYLVYYALALVLPVPIAGKLLITLCVVAVPLLTRRLLQETGTDPGWSWLMIPGSLSVAFYWGFMPFMLASAVGMYLWLLTIRFGRNPTLPMGISIAVCTVVLFFCHVMALGFVALIALTYLAALHVREPRKILLCWLPYTAGLPLIGYWIVSTVGQESYVQGAGVLFGSLSERAWTVFSQPSGQGTMTAPLQLVLSLALLAMPFLAGARISPKLHRWLPFAVAVLVIGLMPAKAFGAILLYHRLSIFLMPLFLLALEFPTGERPKSYYAVLVLVALCALLNINRFSDFNRETLGFSRIMTLMDERKNVMSLSTYPWSRTTQLPTHFHTGVWYQVEKRGIVDFNFAFFYPSFVRFRADQHKWIPNDALVWNPTNFDWENNNGSYYDYFIIYSPDDPAEAIFKESQDQVELVEQSLGWWLYKKPE
jgi:hypothetical protein